MDTRSQKIFNTIKSFPISGYDLKEGLFLKKFLSYNCLSSNLFSLKINYWVVKTMLIFSLLITIGTVQAQVTSVSGPSDAVSNPPVSSSDVSEVLPPQGNISLKIATASASADAIYQWYKIDNTGTKRLVQSSSSATLSENSAGAGYYIYQLVVSNSNQCTSDISDPFKVYVLPPLTPSIAATSNKVCTNGINTSTLTVTPGSAKYSYQYQWMLNGSTVSGATGSTYTLPANLSIGDKAYTVTVSYVLNSTTNGTANQLVTIIPMPAKPTVSVGQ